MLFACVSHSARNNDSEGTNPKAVLIPAKTFYFNSFVDCNMAEAWIGDTFRIFPGKYGEDPLWGYAHDLKYASGNYNPASYDTDVEWSGQCISIARIPLSDLDNPAGKAKRWNGSGFNASFDSVGVPVSSLQITLAAGGGPSCSRRSI